jgi:hypothetical protein
MKAFLLLLAALFVFIFIYTKGAIVCSPCCYIGVSFLVLVLILMCLDKTHRDHYGGPVKVIKKVPFNNGVNIAQQYYKDCMSRYGGYDSDYCRKMYNSKLLEVYYSSFQRM